MIPGIKNLIVQACANYCRSGPAGVVHYCWMKEESNKGICLYFSGDEARCSYFENWVLPLDEDLEDSYKENLKGGSEDGRPSDQRSGLNEIPRLEESGLCAGQK